MSIVEKYLLKYLKIIQNIQPKKTIKKQRFIYINLRSLALIYPPFNLYKN